MDDGADTKDTKGPELPPDLAELQGIAAAQDQVIEGGALAVPGAPAADQAEPPVDHGANLGAMLQLGVAMLAPALPFLPGCYTPEVCTQIGTAVSAVADKRGWDLGAIESPELALAVVAVPPTVAAVVMGRAHFAAKAEAARLAAHARNEARTVDAEPTRSNPSGHGGHVLQPGAVG
jgi:hypothetical protein